MEEINSFLQELDQNIAENFDGDINKVKASVPSHICGSCWLEKKFTIKCYDCSNDDSSCICLKCFQNGQHKGHKVIARYSEGASCDCGDLTMWKKEGFCPHHSGPTENPDITEIPSDLSERFQNCFFKVLSKILEISKEEDHSNSICALMKWIIDKLQYGDATKRCFVKSLLKIDLKKFLEICTFDDGKIGHASCEMLNSLLAEVLFNEEVIPLLTKYYIELIPKFVDVSLEAANNFCTPELICKLEAIKNFSTANGLWWADHKLINLKNTINIKEDFIKLVKLINRCVLESPDSNTYKRSKVSVSVDGLSRFFEKDPKGSKIIIVDFAKELAKVAGKRPFHRYFGDKSNESLDEQMMLHSISYLYSGIIYDLYDDEDFTPEFFDVYAEWLKDTQDELNFDSVLEEGTQISLMVDFHNLLSAQLYLSKDPLKWMKYISEKSGIPLDKVCSLTASLPLKVYASLSYSKFNLFVRNPDNHLLAFLNLKWKYNITYKFIPLFRLIQYCAECCEDKDNFLRDISGIFGKNGDKEKDIVDVVYFVFLMTLAYDRHCLSLDYKECARKTFSFNLKTADRIDNSVLMNNVPYYGTYIHTEKEINKMISEMTTTVQYEKTYFKPNGNVEWVFLLPWVDIKDTYSVIEQFSLKNKNVPFIIPVPESHSDLTKILTSASVFLEIKNCLTSNNKALQYLAYNYIIGIPTFYGSRAQIFLNTLITTLDKSPIGIEVLKRVGITVDQTEEQRAEERKRRKERARAAKNAALLSIKESIENCMFDDIEEPEVHNKNEPTCCVCQANGDENPLFHSIYFSFVSFASIIDKKPIEVLLNIDTCQHLVHLPCISNSCPLDRSPRNALIPLFDTSLSNKDFKISNVKGLMPFLNIFKERNDADFDLVYVAKNIASILVILEARDRLSPSTVNSSGFRYLFKALFRSFWRLFSDISDFSNLSETEMFIFLLLTEENIEEKFKHHVQRIYGKTPKDKRIPFLRRCGILENYLFVDELPQFFDFDNFLEYKNLCEHFEVEFIEGISLEQVSLFVLPDKAIDLLMPPFDEDLYDYHSKTFMCALDGSIQCGYDQVLRKGSEFGEFVPFLKLTGDDALSLQIFKPWGTRISVRYLKSVYTTCDNIESKGWTSIEPLILNKEHLAMVYNSLLSNKLE